MNRKLGRIWQPVLEANGNALPHPGNAQTSKEILLTKTSLASTASSSRQQEELQNGVKQYNREILRASQSFNNSPKPFTRSVDSPQTSSVQLIQHQLSEPTSSKEREIPVRELRTTSGYQPQAKFISQLSQVAEFREPNSVHSDQVSHSHHQQQEENMAPKLVHNQYNSPIDLYSMNNIRKTIEAHTELIAPGLKGINFMKTEAPVNKQSEVYKLVMEEEERRQVGSSTSGPRLSPISGQPVSMTTALARQSEAPRQQQQSQLLSQQAQLNMVAKQPPAAPPKCCECGQLILGPFARVQDRCVHPQCFNCTTCGTSLKNTGYFTVNDKLYCEIHAKQVANMMRISYDFGDVTPACQPCQHRQDSTTAVSKFLEGTASASNCPKHACKVPATISTMFADRDYQLHPPAGEATGAEVRWAWRPMTAQERSNSHIGVGQFDACQQAAQLAQQPAPRTGMSLLKPEGQLDAPRTATCAHCKLQIHGPYILAGKSTWCKACSQCHFNCCSCKRNLLNIGFIEDNSQSFYCENCFEAYHAPICFKCNIRIKGDCLNALQKQWHPSCFVCGHCRRPFGNSSFYLEDNVPYCERDWNLLFTTKCFSCSFPIQAGDKWIEAMDRNYHSNCFRCTSCHANLEGSTFYCKNGNPYCRLHAR